jgi:hypothetical protein
MNRELIDRYEAGGAELKTAYEGLSKSQLHATPIPNTWSLHQIAIHMLDSDLIASDRMKRIAAMDKPLLIGYDETGFNNLPGVDQLDTFAAIDIFAINRLMTAIILRALPDEAFDRFGIHNEIGKVTLGEMVGKYINHLNGHLEWVVKKRAMVA